MLTTFQYVENLLSEADRILMSSGSPSPFQEYLQDSTPIQRKVAHEHILRAREKMRRILDELKIPLNRQVSGSLWAAHNHLAFASLAILEIESKYMEGYGELSNEEKKVFDKISTELREPLDRLGNYLAKGEDVDLPPDRKPSEKPG